MDASGRAKRAATDGGVNRAKGRTVKKAKANTGTKKKPTGKLSEHPAMKKLAEIVAGMTPEQRERFGAAFLDSPPVSDQLREAVKAAPMSRYAISKAIGLGEAALSRFVHGKAGIGLEYFDALCAILGLELRPRRKAKGG